MGRSPTPRLYPHLQPDRTDLSTDDQEHGRNRRSARLDRHGCHGHLDVQSPDRTGASGDDPQSNERESPPLTGPGSRLGERPGRSRRSMPHRVHHAGVSRGRTGGVLRRAGCPASRPERCDTRGHDHHEPSPSPGNRACSSNQRGRGAGCPGLRRRHRRQASDLVDHGWGRG